MKVKKIKINTKTMEMQIQSVMEDNEKTLWQGKADLKSTIVVSLVSALLIVGIAYVIGFFMGGDTTSTCEINGKKVSPEECAKIAGYFIKGLYGLAVLLPLLALWRYKVTYYLVTDRRILLKSGFIGADMRSVYYDQIKSAFVNVGIIGKIFKTGSILIDTGRVTQGKNGAVPIYDRFSNILDPYAVYKTLQDQLTDRKEGLYSGRADLEGNREKYKDFVQETERMKKSV